MDAETEEQFSVLEVEESSSAESTKKPMRSYTREFLLSLSELEVCKKLPRLPERFDELLLSEFHDTSIYVPQERPRVPGGSSVQGFRRTDYGSSPPARGDSSSYSRGIQRWDSRSSGKSKGDSDPESGRRFGSQARKTWHNTEHDGLLGSGSSARPPGFAAAGAVPRFRPNENLQLNKSNEPYQPPRPYKASKNSRKEASGSQLLQPDAGFTVASSPVIIGTSKKPSSTLVVKEGNADIKVEDAPSDRKVGEKKPKMEEGPSVQDLSGYNPKRQEFEIEYDNDAEQLLADMEFKDTDTEAEHQLKLKVLKIYNRRLDERKRRKDFVLERNLLYPDPFEKNLSPEERQICQRYRVFMRFHSKEDHEELIKTVIQEHRIRKRIQELKEAKAAGCRTSAQAEIYIRLKRKREAEENALKMKEPIQGGSAGKVLLRTSHLREFDTPAPSQPIGNSLDDWDITGFPGADLLSETAIQKNRLFILDHHDALMPFVARINSTSSKVYATRTVLFLKDDGTLKVI